MNPDAGAALLGVAAFCCPACPAPKISLEVLLPFAWPKLQPDPPACLFAPPPKTLLPPPPPSPPPPNGEAPPAVLVLPNRFAAEDAGGWAPDPNNPLAEFDAVVFVWPKRVPDFPLVAG